MKKLKSLIYKIAYPAMRVYWYMVRPKTSGVRCVILHEGKVLLIKHAYASSLLTVPGGGMKKHESPEEAIRSEVAEEVGLVIADVTSVGTVRNDKEYKRDTIYVFSAFVLSPILHIDSVEIAEAGWYSLSDLPDTVSPLCKQFLGLAKLTV